MGGRIVDGTAIHLQLSLKSDGTRKIYALGESNPLLILGRDSCYHYTKSVFIFICGEECGTKSIYRRKYGAHHK